MTDALFSPYFGQAGYFKVIGPEEYRIPLAIERYQKEILRVFGVFESVLSKQQWLVGGKYSVADLSFVMYVPMSPWLSLLTLCLESWNELAITVLVNDYNGFNFEKDFPSVYKSVFESSSVFVLLTQSCRWHQALITRPAIASALALRKSLIAK